MVLALIKMYIYNSIIFCIKMHGGSYAIWYMGKI